jgi:hypothetical protein
MRSGLSASRGHTVTTIDLGEKSRRSAKGKSSREKEKGRGDVSMVCVFRNGDGGWRSEFFNENRWTEKDLAGCWRCRRGGEGEFDFRMGKGVTVMAIKLDMLVRAARAGVIMKLCVRLTLQRR